MQLESLPRDVRHAVRRLIGTPGFTLVALVTLALGIGANTAIFSVIHAVLLRPLPYPEPDRLVRIWEGGESGFSTVSPPNFVDFRSLDDVFQDVAAHYRVGLTLTGEEGAERLSGTAVSPSLFSILRVRPELGRAFTPEAETPGRDRVAILSHALWQRRFGGDSEVVGRSIILDGEGHEIVGVMPRAFDYPGDTDLWVPAAFSADELANNRGGHYLLVVARLRDGVTMEAADAGVKALADHLAERYPDTNAGMVATVVGLRDDMVGDYRTALLILAGAVALVLLIACVNVANLFLVRGMDRERDLAVRTALGAGRARLAGELLVESLLLSFAGGLLGLLVAFWGTDALISLQAGAIPRLDEMGLNGPILLFTLAVSLLTGLFFGTLPAWRFSRLERLADRLKAGRGQSEGASSARVRGALVVGELALALLLLSGAGLLLRSFVQLNQVELGLRTERVLTFSLALPEARYPEPAQARRFFQDFLSSAREIPAIEAATGIYPRPPLARTSFMFSVSRVDGASTDGTRNDESAVQLRVVTPDYLRATGIPLRAGRFIAETDRAGAEPVAVLNESAARLIFPEGEPLGHSVGLSTTLGVGDESLSGRVVGVVGDIKEFGPERDAPPIAYFSHAQYPVPSLSVLVRTAGDPGAVIGALRERLEAIDPGLPIYRVRTLGQIAGASLVRPRFYTLLLGLFGAVALILAAVGTYGSIAHTVEGRSREIGIRMALGARSGEILRMVLGRVARLATAGLVIGLAAGLAANRLLNDLLFELSPGDPLTMAGATLVLAGMALLAGYLPARRAARVDPMSVIRME